MPYPWKKIYHHKTLEASHRERALNELEFVMIIEWINTKRFFDFNFRDI